MRGVAISVDNVGKTFRVPLDHGVTLQYRFSHPVSSSRFRELAAVKDVSLEIFDGEFVGITGPNGCGKSTLLKMISRIYEPDEGRIEVRGRVSPFLELGVGFKPELTARENIFLAGAVLGLTRSQLVGRVGDVLDFAELNEFADQKIKNFSSGMAVRLAFSVAMLADADILLLDEVLAVGDARFQEKCFDVFAEYKRQNRTVVLVTHDLGILDLYCDRVFLMQSGRLIAEGIPSEVTGQYRRIVSAMSEEESDQPELGAESSRSRRWGTREIAITSVRLLNGAGLPHHSFLTGEPVTVAVDFSSKTLNGRFSAALGFKRADGVVLSTPDTSAHPGISSVVRAGDRGTIYYNIPAVRLLGASYLLNVGLTDEHLNHVYDAIEDAVEFRVTDEKGQKGLIDLGGNWRFEIAETAAQLDGEAEA